jgi:hypothetical protein
MLSRSRGDKRKRKRFLNEKFNKVPKQFYFFFRFGFHPQTPPRSFHFVRLCHLFKFVLFLKENMIHVTIFHDVLHNLLPRIHISASDKMKLLKKGKKIVQKTRKNVITIFTLRLTSMAANFFGFSLF